MSDMENGYCPLNGHGLYGGKDRECPWCCIVRLKKGIAESCDDMRYEYAGCERAEAAEAKLARIAGLAERWRESAGAKHEEMRTLRAQGYTTTIDCAEELRAELEKP